MSKSDIIWIAVWAVLMVYDGLRAQDEWSQGYKGYAAAFAILSLMWVTFITLTLTGVW